MQSKIRRRVVRGCVAVTGLGVAFVALVGFAHTEAGRPLLRYLPGMGGSCPHAELAQMSAVDRDRARARTLAPFAGADSTDSRDALGFVLGTSDRATVVAWARDHGVTCEASGSTLRCDGVPAVALDAHGGESAVAFGFDAADRLVAVDRSARLPDADAASRWVTDRTEQLSSRLGAPSSTRGSAGASHIGRAALSQVSAEFRRVELRAQVSVTNLGRGRFAARESYQALGT